MEDVVINDPQISAVPDKGQGGGQEEKVTLTRAEVDAMQREAREARESERYWAGLARSTGKAQETVPVVPDVDPKEFLEADETQPLEGDTPAKLIDDFAAQGVKALEKRGMVTAAEARRIATDTAVRVAQELIGRERQKMGTDQQIITEFPELKDQSSDLYKETAIRYQRAIKMDPNAARSPAALYLAAESAKEALKGRTPVRRDDGQEPEEDRQARAAAQDGRTRGRGESHDATDMLGPEAKQLIAAMNITEAEYRDSIKQYGGGRGRGRR